MLRPKELETYISDIPFPDLKFLNTSLLFRAYYLVHEGDEEMSEWVNNYKGYSVLSQDEDLLPSKYFEVDFPMIVTRKLHSIK